MYLFARKIIIRDLEKVLEQLTQAGNDKNVWKILPGVTNSIGTLTVHICGNLRHFIGHIIGNSGYLRDRDSEFSGKTLSTEDLQSLLNQTIHEVSDALNNADVKRASDPYPIEIANNKFSNAEALSYLIGHLEYHLGQLNYLRRIIVQ